MAERSLGKDALSEPKYLGHESERSGTAADMFRSRRDQAIAEARGMVNDVTETQCRKAAEALSGVARVLHKTAMDVDAENKTMARYTDMAADRLDQAAHYLRKAHFNEMIEEAEGFARRQPWLFLGAAAVAGFLVARAVKSTGSEPEAASLGHQQPLSGTGSASIYGQSQHHATTPGDAP